MLSFSVRKTVNRFRFSFRQTEPSQNLTSVRVVFWQKLCAICNPDKKWQKVTTCIYCADKELFETLPKQNLEYRFQNAVKLLACCHFVVSDISVIFAVNLIKYSAITQAVNNCNIRTEPHFLKLKQIKLTPKRIRVFYEKPNRNIKIYFCHPYMFRNLSVWVTGRLVLLNRPQLRNNLPRLLHSSL